MTFQEPIVMTDHGPLQRRAGSPRIDEHRGMISVVIPAYDEA